ncbi:hypothetical protein NDU88_005362 [Pleurodeles waltl]|uniref:Uncharacterized protein n=1 Tax=Pleurodeles waltl TaxID=8319 RepID=A0AAV7LKW7_PLEWA|nr:hypothetical protein NDU88_005362 [Pleurodeles waltl]
MSQPAGSGPGWQHGMGELRTAIITRFPGVRGRGPYHRSRKRPVQGCSSHLVYQPRPTLSATPTISGPHPLGPAVRLAGATPTPSYGLRSRGPETPPGPTAHLLRLTSEGLHSGAQRHRRKTVSMPQVGLGTLFTAGGPSLLSG